MDYYNTCELDPELVKVYTGKARSQDAAILEFYRSEPYGAAYTPDEINRFVLPNAPITSVRRALTNLTSTGALVKSDVLANGPCGHPVHYWTLALPVQLECFQ